MIKQRIGDNCLSVCLHNLMQIPLKDIPDFDEYPDDSREWFYELNKFLEPMGLFVFPFETAESEDEFFKTFYPGQQILHITLGKSSKNGKPFFDPNPDDNGLDEIDYHLLICKKFMVWQKDEYEEPRSPADVTMSELRE